MTSPDGRLRKVGDWVGLRDEGDRITLSYKQLNDRTLHGMHEVLVTVSDFEAADALLQAIGLKVRTYQETKRESWRLGEFEIELDEWPWAKPFVEIEGPDEASLKDLAAKLGLDWDTVCHGSAEIVYRAEYDLTDAEFNNIPILTFDQPMPEILVSRR
jgi:adenylate cyclase class 2